MSTATTEGSITVKKTVLVKGKYPAKEWNGTMMADLEGYSNLRCAVMGGSFFIKAKNQFASQMSEGKEYEIKCDLTEFITQKGQLHFNVGEVLEFKAVS